MLMLTMLQVSSLKLSTLSLKFFKYESIEVYHFWALKKFNFSFFSFFQFEFLKRTSLDFHVGIKSFSFSTFISASFVIVSEL
jgi:hypothetical protein